MEEDFDLLLSKVVLPEAVDFNLNGLSKTDEKQERYLRLQILSMRWKSARNKAQLI